MNLEVLSSSDSMTLCRAAAQLALSRFRKLGQQAAERDPKLSRLFVELAGDMERHLGEIHQLDGQDDLPDAHRDQMREQVARGFLPSLSKATDELRLDRESGFHLVECILEELAGFYGTLVRQSCDEKSRDLLRRLGLAIQDRVGFLHQVVL